MFLNSRKFLLSVLLLIILFFISVCFIRIPRKEVGSVFSAKTIDNTCDFLFVPLHGEKVKNKEKFKNIKKIYLLEAKEDIFITDDFEWELNSLFIKKSVSCDIIHNQNAILFYGDEFFVVYFFKNFFK